MIVRSDGLLPNEVGVLEDSAKNGFDARRFVWVNNALMDRESMERITVARIDKALPQFENALATVSRTKNRLNSRRSEYQSKLLYDGFKIHQYS